MRLTLVLAAALTQAALAVDFDREIRPILSDKCFTCHGPDAVNRTSPLRFDTEEGALVELASGGRAIVPGKPDESKLIARITSDDPVRRMPPAYAGHDQLPEDQIAKLREWIAAGAPWSGHWAFAAPRRPEPPAVRHEQTVRNPIDRFILRRLEDEGLTPSPQADRATLARRVSLDLTGLPPSPAAAEAFAGDSSPKAYEELVDRLLASPQYGERMATPWLDAARYADTNGYQSDGVRSMWRWRDWVVDAFNRNTPFDQFTIEQLAGDLLDSPTRDQTIATAFNRNHRTSAEGGIVEEEFLVEYAADRAETTGTVWLGLTVGCARCHDHKFDPISQKDFYRLFAYFNNIPERGLVYNFGNDGPRIKAPTADQEAKLVRLDAELAAAENQWRSFDKKLDQLQARWERDLQRNGVDSPIQQGLVAHFALDGLLGVDSRQGVDDDKRELESQPTAFDFDQGVFGNAGEFDGERFIDGGSVAGFDYDEPYTVSLWIRPKELDGGVISHMQDHEAGSGWGLFLRDGRLRFEFTMRHTDHSMRVETERAIAADSWRHVAITYTGERPSHNGLTIAVDGETWPFEVEWDDLKWPIGYRGYPLRIGAAGGERFAGLIDEVRIYNRALDADGTATLALHESAASIAAIAPANRTAAQQRKLRLAFLENGAPREIREARLQLADARRARNSHFDQIPTVMVMEEGEKRQAHVLRRGAYDARGEPVEAALPAELATASADFDGNRLGLARWLVDRSNPLTARVTVNRYWQMLFGTGLVKTAEDFGSQGERPSHPDLLDWLAVEFMESGWDVKHILRTIVTSGAYRQSSRATPELTERDPENRLLARGPRFRLPAEAVRDQALFASGLLVDQIGGPPVKPYQPPGLWQEVSGARYKPDTGHKLYRRSLYTYWKRTVAPPGMAGFDAPDRESCSVRRPRTNTPLQALTLMNDVTYIEAARKMAERMIREGGDDARSRLDRGIRLALARPAKDHELRTLATALAGFEKHFQAEPFEAREYLEQGQSEYDRSLAPAELAAYANVASLILNLDEAVTKQ